VLGFAGVVDAGARRSVSLSVAAVALFFLAFLQLRLLRFVPSDVPEARSAEADDPGAEDDGQGQ
jgi:hypothetical protein